MLSWSSAAHSQQKEECPARIGVVSDEKLSHDASEIMVKIYTALGCSVDIVQLPRRRGFMAFNNKTVDGELFRFPIGADNYTRPYIRSGAPLFDISNSLWAAPESKRRSELPIGYMFGIVWQQNYLKSQKLPKSGHLDISDLILHYNNGTLDRFLAEDSMVKNAILNGAFEDGNEPVQLEQLTSGPLYHFLGAEFTPFMKRFSAYLIKHKPFAALSSPAQLPATR